MDEDAIPSALGEEQKDEESDDEEENGQTTADVGQEGQELVVEGGQLEILSFLGGGREKAYLVATDIHQHREMGQMAAGTDSMGRVVLLQ